MSVTSCNEVNIVDTSVVSVAVVEVAEQVIVTDVVTETIAVDEGPLVKRVPYYGQVSRITSGVINIATAGTYQSTGLSATLDAEVNGFSLGTTDNFALKNTSGKTILVDFYASADIEAGNNKVLGIKLAKNGTPINQTECNAPTGLATSFAKLITSWLIELAPNDEVALFVTNFTNTGNVTLQRGRIIAKLVRIK